MKMKYPISVITGLLLAAGGAYAQTTGEMSGDNIFLKGVYTEVAVGPNGAFGSTIDAPSGYHNNVTQFFYDPGTGSSSSVSTLGFVADPDMDGWSTGTPHYMGDYFMPGDPQEGWAIEVGGTENNAYMPNFESSIHGYSYGSGTGSYSTAILTGYGTGGSGTVSYSMIGSVESAVWKGHYGYLVITATTTLDTSKLYFTTRVELRNSGSTDMTDIYYMRELDPDNEEPWGGSGFSTDNKIVYSLPDPGNKVLVSANGTGWPGHSYLGLGTKDCRAMCFICTGGLTPNDDPATIYSGSASDVLTSGELSSDVGVGLIFKICSLPAGDSTELAYAYILNESELDSALDETATSFVIDSVAHTLTDTVNACYEGSDTVVVNIINGGYYSWSWYPDTGLSDTTGTSVVIHLDSIPSSGIVYTVIGTATGCACAGDTFTIAVVGGSVGAAAHNNGPICAGTPLYLTEDSTYPGATYSWVGPDTFTSSLQNPVISAATTDASGIYTVTVTRGICTAVAYDTVVVWPAPDTPILTTNAPICQGNTLSFTASDAVAGSSFTWTGPSFSSTLSNPSIDNAEPSSTGWYTVTATIGTCTATDSIYALVNANPDTPYITTTPVCSGGTLSFSVPGVTGTTYSWAGPPAFTSTDQNPSITPAEVSNSGTYTVTATLNGCSITETATATVKQTPSVPDATNNSPICAGSTLILTATDSVAGVIYAWAGPGFIDTSATAVSIGGATTAASGIYTVTAILDGCSNSSTTTVVVNPMPLDPVVTASTPICSGNTLTFSVPTTPGATYSWAGPDSFTSTDQNPSIAGVTLPAMGEYTVTVMLGPCSLTDSGYVEVDSTPTVPNATNSSPVCSGNTLYLYGQDSTAGVSYNWAGPSSYTSTSENPIIYSVPVTAAGIYTLTVQLGNCSSTAATTVTVNQTPAAPDVTGNSPVCSGSALMMSATSDAGSTFSWTGPDSFTSTSATPEILNAQVDNSGPYTVIASLNGCNSSPSVYVAVVNPTPGLPVTTNVFYCKDAISLPLTADGINLLWYTVDSGGVGSTLAPIPATDSVDTVTYYVSQVVNGCESGRSPLEVIIWPRPPLTVSPVDTSVCPGDTVQYISTIADSGVTYTWSPEMYLNDATLADPVSRPVTSTVYTVTTTDANGCHDTVTVTVNVHPAALLTLDDSVTIYPGESYTMSPLTNCVTFLWFPPLGLSADNISNPVAAPDVSTKYVVTASTEWGCKAIDSIEVNVSTESLLAIPNAFSPGTGPNSELKILKRGEATLKMFRIYNRWGNKVFETTDIDEGWDGKYNGQPQPFGVYVYEIEAVTSTGKPFNKQGNVTLIR